MVVEIANRSNLDTVDDKTKLFVKINDKQIFSINVNKSDQVSNVVNMIMTISGVEGSNLKLMYQGMHLDETSSIEECELTNGNFVQFIHGLEGGMQIFVKNVEGKIYTIEVSPQDTVGDLKNKIYEKSGFSPNEQKLVFKNVSMMDDQVINGVGIKASGEVNLVIRKGDGMKVYCRVKSGREIEMFVQASDSVGELKKQICDEIGSKLKETDMIFAKRVLRDDCTIEESGIVDGSDIDVIEKKNTNFVIYAAAVLVVLLLLYELWNMLHN